MIAREVAAPSAAWAALACVAAAACATPSVSIDFDIPERYEDEITSVSIRILVPPPSEPFGCKELAFLEVDDETLSLSTVQERTASDGTSIDLDGIPRKGTKLFHARGLDTQGLAVVSACAEVGDITEDVSLALDGEPAALVVILGGTPGGALPSSVEAVAVDPLGAPLPDRTIAWRVTGPAGATSEGVTTTAEGGRASFQPVVPTAAPGPIALDVRARWGRPPAPVLRAFTAPPVLFEGVVPGTGDTTLATEVVWQVGRIGPNGEPGFAVLGPTEDPGAGRTALVAYYDAAADPPFRTATTDVTGAAALGLVTRDGRDRPFTITPTSWIELEPDGGVSTFASPLGGAFATRVVPADPCGDDAITAVLVATSRDELVTVDADRQPIAGVFNGMGGRLTAAGCVGGLGDDVHRTVVFSSSSGSLTLVANMDGARTGTVAALRSGVGFAPRIGEEGERLLAAELDIDGTALNRYRLVAVGGANLDAESVTVDDTPSVPLSSTGGDLDGDGLGDVAALLSFGEDQRLTQVRMFLALGAAHGGGRLVGLSGPRELERPRMFVYDFDGDGIDDVLLAAAASFTVLRMGPPP